MTISSQAVSLINVYSGQECFVKYNNSGEETIWMQKEILTPKIAKHHCVSFLPIKYNVDIATRTITHPE